MVNDALIPRITIEDANWQQTGDYLDDPLARLATEIIVNDRRMRIEAFEIKKVAPGGENLQELRDEEADGALAGSASFPVAMHEIGGRKYVLMMSPSAA